MVVPDRFLARFFGGAAANPNHIVARILADLRDAEGRVQVPGFYDGVPELPDEATRPVAEAVSSDTTQPIAKSGQNIIWR